MNIDTAIRNSLRPGQVKPEIIISLSAHFFFHRSRTVIGIQNPFFIQHIVVNPDVKIGRAHV